MSAPHSEPFRNTRTSEFLSREGEGREIIGERLRVKTVPWQVHLRLVQAVKLYISGKCIVSQPAQPVNRHLPALGHG